MNSTASAAAGAEARGINRNRLFIMACLSLIVTAMTFAIRAGWCTSTCAGKPARAAEASCR